MRYIAALLFLLAGSIMQAQAQTADTLPDPETIFADGVQWAVYESTPGSHTYTDDRQVRIVDDADAADALEVFNASTGQWELFPLPSDEHPVRHVAMRENGQVIVTTGSEQDYGATNTHRMNLPRFYWLLNRQTGDYEQLPSVCEGIARQPFPDESGEWIAVNPNEHLSITEPFLCYTADDTRHELPADETLFSWHVTETPDPEKLVLIAGDFSAAGTHQVFVYHIPRKQLLSVDHISGFDAGVRVCGWVSETHGVICVSSNRSYLGTGFYELNITQPDTLERLFAGRIGQETFYLNDPVRFVNLYAPSFIEPITGSMAADDARCILSVYDADGLQTYDMGKDCVPFHIDHMTGVPFYRQGDTIYLLSIETDTATVSTLHRFNTQTLEHRTLRFSMEMEAILSVSPDGRYIAVLLDDNDELDIMYYGREFCCPEHNGKRVAILTIADDDFLYQSQPLGVYTGSDVMWLDNQTMIINSQGVQQSIMIGEDNEWISYYTSPSLHRVTLTDTGYHAQSSTIASAESLYPGFRVDMRPDSPFAIVNENQIIDLRTLDKITFLQPEIREQYAVRVYRTSQGAIQMTLSDPAGDRVLQTYVLQLP